MRKKILLLLLFILAAVIWAQTGTPTSSLSTQGFATGSAYLYSGTLASADQLKIKSYIWGQVRKPGLYIVPDDTDVLTLISLAGGPTENAKLSKVRIIRPTSEGEKIIWLDLKEYMETGNENLIPILSPGDTVIVSGTVFYAFTKWADFLSKAAIFLSVYVTISNIK